jgi:hypothetical protein
LNHAGWIGRIALAEIHLSWTQPSRCVHLDWRIYVDRG